MRKSPEQLLADIGVSQLPPASRIVDDPAPKANSAGAPEKIVFTPTPFQQREYSTFPRRQFLYARHYIRRYLSCTVAPSGVGKSSKALVEAVAMASGRNLLGQWPSSRLRVWYWNGEDPLEEIERRVGAICLHYRVEPVEIIGNLWLDSGRATEIIIASQARNGAVIATPAVHGLTTAIRQNKIDVLIVDPFVSAHRVCENDNMAIDAVASAFAGIADETDSSCELVHHVRKTGGAEITVEDGRGASSLGAKARSLRVLNPMTKDEADRADVGDARRLYFRCDVGKSNLAPPADKAEWFKIVSIGLGNGSSGSQEDQDMVGVVSAWQWPNALDGITVSDLRAVQVRVENGRFRKDNQAKEWVGHVIADVLHLDAGSKADRAKIGSLFKTWCANGMFRFVDEADEKRMRKTYVKVDKWAND